MGPLLVKPIRYFTENFNNYFKLFLLSVEKESLPYFESEAIILYFTRGKGTITINGVDFNLQLGTFCLLHSYHVFQIKAEKGHEIEYSALIFDYPLSGYMAFSKEVLSDKREKTFHTIPVVLLNSEEKERVESILSTFKEEDAIHDCSSVLIKTALYSRLFTIYIQAVNHMGSENLAFKLPRAWSILLFLSKYNYMDINSKSVSEYFQISISELNRELRNITGYNFSYLLNRARINFTGASLLLQDVSLRSITAHSGFSTENAFYRAFKYYKGMTPNEYRKAMTDTNLLNPRKFIYESPSILLQYIMMNCRYPITIKQAEKDLYMTEDNIKSILKQFFNTSFQELLTVLRMKFAEALLMISSLPVYDIAISSGFNNINTFIRLFKEVHQITPNKYRLEYRGE